MSRTRAATSGRSRLERLSVPARARHRSWHGRRCADRGLGSRYQSLADARSAERGDNSAPASQSTAPRAPPADDGQAKFVSQILRSTEVVWGHTFQEMGRTYEDPKLVLFRDSYPTACGLGQQAARPFYCPNDRNVSST